MTRIATFALVLLGTVVFLPSAGEAQTSASSSVYFGDDSGDWPHDDECDDPRFVGDEVALFADDVYRDATDCRALFERRAIHLRNDATRGTSIERGELRRADAMPDGSRYVDIYSFEGQAGDVVAIDVRSGAFDTTVAIETPSGSLHENDDHEGDTSRSVVMITLEEAGVHHIFVSSYHERETGDYTLWINTVSADLAGGVWDLLD